LDIIIITVVKTWRCAGMNTKDKRQKKKDCCQILE